MITGQQKLIITPTPFTLCVDNMQQIQDISDALTYYNYSITPIPDGIDLFLNSLAYYDNPPCVASCDEDTLDDDYANLIDGIVGNFQEGGIVSAIGYVIDQLGRVVFSTALKYIAVSVLGAGIGGIVSLIVDNVLVDTVEIFPADNIIEIIFDTGLDNVNVANVEILFEAVA